MVLSPVSDLVHVTGCALPCSAARRAAAGCAGVQAGAPTMSVPRTATRPGETSPRPGSLADEQLPGAIPRWCRPRQAVRNAIGRKQRGCPAVGGDRRATGRRRRRSRGPMSGLRRLRGRNATVSRTGSSGPAISLRWRRRRSRTCFGAPSWTPPPPDRLVVAGVSRRNHFHSRPLHQPRRRLATRCPRSDSSDRGLTAAVNRKQRPDPDSPKAGMLRGRGCAPAHRIDGSRKRRIGRRYPGNGPRLPSGTREVWRHSARHGSIDEFRERGTSSPMR